jgi:hypothetical protein
LRKFYPFRYKKPLGNQTDLTKIEPPWHIIIKTISTESRERILKAIREKKQIMYKSKPIKITDFSSETLKARESSEVFWALS